MLREMQRQFDPSERIIVFVLVIENVNVDKRFVKALCHVCQRFCFPLVLGSVVWADGAQKKENRRTTKRGGAHFLVASYNTDKTSGLAVNVCNGLFASPFEAANPIRNHASHPRTMAPSGNLAPYDRLPAVTGDKYLLEVG